MSGPGTAASGSRPRVLSIAGTDPTGGAGIQADLKSFAAHGAYGMAVVTALVAQNTHGVREVRVPDVAFLRAQLDAVSDDVTVDAVKIGMLANAAVADEVGDWLTRHRPPFVVLDPVMVATSGDRLLDDDAVAAVRRLVALADVVTPNLPELAVLADEPVASTWTDAVSQAGRLSRTAGVTVLVKGGHLSGPQSPDALVDGAGVVELPGTRVATTSTHGTGCSLSAALAALRPRRRDWASAARDAKHWLGGAIAAGEALQVGSGHGPVDHLHHVPTLGLPPFTDEVDGVLVAACAESLDQPLVRGLADGTLPFEAFAEQLHQDALYLTAYSRVLARASTLAPTPDAQEFFARGAHSCLAVERSLHETYLARADVRPSTPTSAVTRAYVDHLAAVAAHGSYAEVVAAVLPCYWLYAEVGVALLARADGVPGHPYRDWVATYGSAPFTDHAAHACRLADAAAQHADPGTRSRMVAAFATSCAHEVAFFGQVAVTSVGHDEPVGVAPAAHDEPVALAVP
ncbi:bifunctional hydroxymethylpyrimidine kinase/phosphomethylpyrimidine kinase [Cellulomonas fimi]|uniref:bifunctional hydroxymethylpyrimidine kinase/phosphomethylpyrimidine kinase n=1 Tax=Cellulomonas fimi TaxID=1708 RepID=UPI00234C6740|nr:bifunctional hydroxymethylpyrimidine kinase/phosphomethylpyrimidine kinase [Cellulomonas fimi]MDC7123005.1 bifunctional hydroxymethylpyrimidine kinase/phosphomethylpyrimidine kinase [Cellulomonas fimi]